VTKLIRADNTMITEITTAIMFSFGVIGAIMAMKWKSKNGKPRLSDKDIDKFNRSRDVEKE
tara:strand:+ start:364 stop:546 length:183 start_codon:yes stop_codon:yes gene_type:complete